MLDFSHPSSICWTGCPGDLVPRYQSAPKERPGRWVTPRMTSTNFKRRTTRLSVSPGGDGDGGEDEERVSEGRTLELKIEGRKDQPVESGKKSKCGVLLVRHFLEDLRTFM